MAKKKKVTTTRPSLERDLTAYKPETLAKLLKNSKGSKVKVEDKLNPTVFEPKVSNRWICYIENDQREQIVPSYLIKGFARPSIMTHLTEGMVKKRIACGPNLERQITTPPLSRRVIFTDDIGITAYDPIEPSASKIFTNLLNNDVVFTVRLIFLGPVGDNIEEWVYRGCKIKSLEFTHLEWGQDNEPSHVYAHLSVASSKII